MKIIAIDIGSKNCGYAIYRDYVGTNPYFKSGYVGVEKLLDVLPNMDIETIVLEKFICQRILNKSYISTIEFIGAVKYIANRKFWHIVEQSPQIKKFFDNKKLKQLDLYKRNGHERDAIRHLLYYLKFKKGKEMKTNV